MDYIVKFTWDEEANVWYATSDDIPGLVLESESFDTLAERVRVAACMDTMNEATRNLILSAIPKPARRGICPLPSTTATLLGR